MCKWICVHQHRRQGLAGQMDGAIKVPIRTQPCRVERGSWIGKSGKPPSCLKDSTSVSNANISLNFLYFKHSHEFQELCMEILPPRWHRPQQWPLSQNCGGGQWWVAIVTSVHEAMPPQCLAYVVRGAHESWGWEEEHGVNPVVQIGWDCSCRVRWAPPPHFGFAPLQKNLWPWRRSNRNC